LTAPDDDTGPLRAFDESRRLPGANLYHAVPSVVLVPLGPAAQDGAAHGRWAGLVHAQAFALGWPNPQPRVHEHGRGVILAFAAPVEALFTATEINEWAWERAAPGVHEAAGLVPAHPATDQASAHFKARAAAERSRPLALLRQATAARGLPWMEDDDAVSIGEGSGSVLYARGALPLPMDVPWGRLHEIPKVLVTGSNGKTTTTRLLAAMASACGLTPGLSGTEGVWIGGRLVHSGDWAGPAGARAVLRDSRVTAALLETARGGILRRGLAVQRADVAAVLNVSADHFGEYGIHSVADIATAKLTVAHAVAGRGTLVLGGTDETLLRTAMHLPHAAACNWALFARDHEEPLLAALRRHGGSTCGVHEGRLWLTHHRTEHDLGAIDTMPLAMGGAAGYNIDNMAAAALIAAHLNWPLESVAAALQRFGEQPADNPGRLERWAYRGATVLVDYAHNPDGLHQLLKVARALRPRRLGLLLGQAGNRDDAAITELARTAAAERPDQVVVKELPLMLRGRVLGEVSRLLEHGLLQAGVAAKRILLEPDEAAAARRLLDWAQPGDVLVLPLHTTAVREQVAGWLSDKRT
jgi:cyanophycin synthetase